MNSSRAAMQPGQCWGARLSVSRNHRQPKPAQATHSKSSKSSLCSDSRRYHAPTIATASAQPCAQVAHRGGGATAAAHHRALLLSASQQPQHQHPAAPGASPSAVLAPAVHLPALRQRRAGSQALPLLTVPAARSSGGGGSGTGGPNAVQAQFQGNMTRAAVGIDLGTTTSAVAVSGPDGRPVVVEDEGGRAVVPSVVFVQQDGSVLVGAEAVAAAEADPANAFYGIKRLMGRSYGEAIRELDEQDPPPRTPAPEAGGQAGGQGARRRLRSYGLVEGPGGRVEVACPALGRSLTPQEVSAHLIRHLVVRAAAFLKRQQQRQQRQQRQSCPPAEQPGGGGGGGGDGGSGPPLPVAEGVVQVLDAVVTVPAHFSPVQRRAVVEAAREAGLQRVTLLQEPIAAAMAYGFGSPHVPYDVLLVFDLGGGTLDLTIVEAFDGIMEVLSTSGDNYLGGDDFTAAVADWLIGLQHQQHQQHQQQEEVQQEEEVQQGQGAHAHHRQQHQHAEQLPHQGGPSPPAAAAATATATAASISTLAVLRLAEAAKLALSEAEAAARESTRTRGGRSDGPGSSGGGSSGGASSVRVRLPSAIVGVGAGVGAAASGGCASPPTPSSAAVGRQSGPSGGEAEAEVELTHGTFEDLVRPLLRRFWWPLEEVALATRTQLAGRLPPAWDPRSSSSSSSMGDTAGITSASTGAGSSSSSVQGSGLPEGPGRREGAAAWEFSIFPPPPSSPPSTSASPSSSSSWAAAGASSAAAAATAVPASAAKYVAPPRRLSGLVLVGAATRLPVVRDYITQVAGLPVRPGVDPETAVALGAALHAGLMVGSVAGGIEMNDGGYVAAQHGRASGFQTAAAAGASASVSDLFPSDAADAGGALVWEP